MIIREIMKGKITIDFERDEIEGKCSFSLKQDDTSKLNKEDLINLFEYIIRDLME